VTPAQASLAKKQASSPPQYPLREGKDRALQKYEVLAPALPGELRELVTSGAVAIGEVGRFVPDLATIPVSGGGFVIEFTTGMMDFAYAVGRAMAGIHVGHNDSGPENEVALGIDRLAQLVAEVFDQWRRHVRWSWLRPGKRIQYAQFAIAPGPREWIEGLVTNAEIFMLGHELGHVALNRRLRSPEFSSQEESADALGLEFFLIGAETRLNRRIAYAAPVFALLLFEGLERIGVKFSAAYPPQSKRIELLRRAVRARCPSEQAYYELTTTMVSYQDLMDDIIRHIDKKFDTVAADAERILVRLIAQLIEVGAGKVSVEVFIRDITDIAKRNPEKIMRQAAEKLIDFYVPPPPQESVLSPELRLKMGVALATTVANLPQPARAFFPTGKLKALP